MTKSKTIHAENARLFFTLTHCQFFNGVIPAHVYVERLVKLRSLINSNTALYRILNDILGTLQVELPKEGPCKTIELGKNYKISEIAKENIDRIAHEEKGGIILFMFRIADPDPLPSIPHIHDDENKCKIDIYTGKRYSLNNTYDNTKIPDEELAEIWNGKDYKKIKKNMETLKHRIH